MSADARLLRLLEPDALLAALVELIDERIDFHERERDEWIDTETASVISGLSADAIRERCARGTLEKRYTGRRLLVRRRDMTHLRDNGAAGSR